MKHETLLTMEPKSKFFNEENIFMWNRKKNTCYTYAKNICLIVHSYDFNFLKHIFMNLKFCSMRTLHWFFKRQFGPVPTILVVQARRAASLSMDGTL